MVEPGHTLQDRQFQCLLAVPKSVSDLDFFGWQARLNAAFRQFIEEHPLKT